MRMVFPGVTLTKDKNWKEEIYVKPNLSKRKLFVYPVTIAEVVKAFIRNRLRQLETDLQCLKWLFVEMLPEYSSYVVTCIILEAAKLPVFPDDVFSYISHLSYFTPVFDVQTYGKVCQEYAGNAPVTKKHFVKIIHLTSAATVNIMIQNITGDVKAHAIYNLIAECTAVLSRSEHRFFIEDFPMHTWYFPLDTFPVKTEDVVRSVIRSRISKKFNIYSSRDYLACSESSLMHDLIDIDLPEYTSYQIRCIIDEVEDLEKDRFVFSYQDEKFIRHFRPFRNDAKIACKKASYLYLSDPGPVGILKILLFTSSLALKLIDLNKSPAEFLIRIIHLLNSPLCQPLFDAHSWHTWYKQDLPSPSLMIETKSELLKCYMFPPYHVPDDEIAPQKIRVKGARTHTTQQITANQVQASSIRQLRLWNAPIPAPLAHYPPQYYASPPAGRPKQSLPSSTYQIGGLSMNAGYQVGLSALPRPHSVQPLYDYRQQPSSSFGHPIASGLVPTSEQQQLSVWQLAQLQISKSKT